MRERRSRFERRGWGAGVSEGSTCAACGAPAAEVVTFTIRGVPYEKDLCLRHMEDLIRGARGVHETPAPAFRVRHAPTLSGRHEVARSRERRAQD